MAVGGGRERRAVTGLLTLDRGNSTLDCCVHDDAERLQRVRLSPDDLDGVLRLVAGAGGVARAVACTVVADGLAAVGAALRSHGVPLAIAGDDLPCPLRLTYEPAEALGVDRWVAAFAACALHPRAIVVDAGTALTVDAVARTGAGPGAEPGVFLGGCIAPGARTMRAGLAGAAPGLPVPDLEVAGAALPNSSEEAVRSGLQLAFCGAVERLVAEVRHAAGLPPDTPVLLTGGDAPLYLRRGVLAVELVEDLVHRGLALLADRP